MTDTLLILHLIGLMMGAGGGLGSTVAMRRANSLPEQEAKTIRGLGPILARVSLAGLILLWATGVTLLLMSYSIEAMPVMFWIKMVFVLTLTIAAASIEVVYARVKAGDAKAALLLPRLGPMAGLSAVLAVIFAVLTFH